MLNGLIKKEKGEIKLMNKEKNGSLIDILYQASNKLEKISLFLAGIFFVTTVSVVIFAVISRYFFGTSYIWTDELARFSLIYLVMIVANAALKSEDHMKIEFAQKRFSDQINNIFRWIRIIISVVVYILMTYKGLLYAWDAWDKTTIGLGIPRAIPLLAIPIGMLLLLMQYILMQIIEIYEN